MIKQTKKERLNEVKDYLNEVLSNPFSIEVKVTEDNGNIIVDCGCWVLKKTGSMFPQEMDVG